MNPRRVLGWSLLSLGIVACGACRGRPGHPLLDTVRSVPETRPVATRLPEPPPPSGAAARAQLFLGLANVDTPLAVVRRHETPVTTSPRLILLPKLERAVLQRYARGTALGAVRSVAAFGFCARFPIPPRETADLLMDPEAERAVLAADSFSLERVELQLPDASRMLYRVELRRRGQGPFRFNFSFTSRTERWDLPDGVVLLRHDPTPDPRSEHVTLYRGATVIEPVGSGSRVTEFLVLGTDVSVPFFLRGPMRSQSVKVFADRATNMWKRAVMKAAAR